ncbi:(2Fe-2S)-binding protein [Streptacidiphilus sp. EB103A]|uniref:(2Fe-2S)-binding protein n=1 Tax=Streptacidiphilus sp. EB103A TaxID=3156275 RepID=UPI003512952F
MTISRPTTGRRASRPPESVTVTIDGVPGRAWAGQSVSAVLVAAGIWPLRRNQVNGRLRGPFCGMGVCMECEVTIDGRPDSRSCTAHVAEGTDIRTHTEPGTEPDA